MRANIVSIQDVSAKVKTGDRADKLYTVKYNIPDTLEEAVAALGDEVVYSRFKQSLVIDLQSFMRTQIKKDDATLDSIQEAVSEWSPGVRAAAKPLSEKIEELLQRMSPEERTAFLEEIM